MEYQATQKVVAHHVWINFSKGICIMAVYSNDVQKIYIAYYGRPADAFGLAFWESQIWGSGGNLSAIIGSFGASPEFDARLKGYIWAHIMGQMGMMS